MSIGRHFDDWISAYLEYSGFSEAPKRMRFWCAVSAIAGALRRRVWIDMGYFQWTPNFFVILVAPPGIVGKSSTTGVAMNILRQVPGVKFGPQVCTWQSLVQSLENSQEQFQVNGHDAITSAELTIESGEFGNLINPQDREMVDLLVTLWDSPQVFKKTTKMSGNNTIEHPWLNIIACTTPSWIAGNFPEYMIGGGFTSRCVFIYAEEKEKYVPYPGLAVPSNLGSIRSKLAEDLVKISTSCSGPYRLLPSAVEWGTQWYEYHFKNRPPNLDDERFGGYIARKQTHIHKLAMVLAASQRDELTINVEDLQTANAMVTDLERDMPKVFAHIGRSEQSQVVMRLVGLVRREGALRYDHAYKFLAQHYPSEKEMVDVLAGALRAGLLMTKRVGDYVVLVVGSTEGEEDDTQNDGQVDVQAVRPPERQKDLPH